MDRAPRARRGGARPRRVPAGSDRGCWLAWPRRVCFWVGGPQDQGGVERTRSCRGVGRVFAPRERPCAPLPRRSRTCAEIKFGRPTPSSNLTCPQYVDGPGGVRARGRVSRPSGAAQTSAADARIIKQRGDICIRERCLASVCAIELLESSACLAGRLDKYDALSAFFGLR